LHILGGILWFGNSLVLAVILIPALNRLPISAQREIGSHIGEISQNVASAAGGAKLIVTVLSEVSGATT